MRARNIKPGFFCNEELVELSPVCRLFFIGLWCFADREGRFEARPTKIKMAIFPAESHDIQAMLNDLTRTGFLHFYEVNGSKFYEINNFARHQKPHIREQESNIPPRNEQSTALAVPEHNLGTVEPALNEDCGMRIVDCGKMKDGSPALPGPQAAPAGLPTGFAEFWEAYPKKKSKGVALKAWIRLAPNAELRAVMMAAIQKQKGWPEWVKEGGEFIPHPATWINAMGWTDEPKGTSKPTLNQDHLWAGAEN